MSSYVVIMRTFLDPDYFKKHGDIKYTNRTIDRNQAWDRIRASLPAPALCLYTYGTDRKTGKLRDYRNRKFVYSLIEDIKEENKDGKTSVTFKHKILRPSREPSSKLLVGSGRSYPPGRLFEAVGTSEVMDRLKKLEENPPSEWVHLLNSGHQDIVDNASQESSIEKKGKEAEEKFRKWLDLKDIPYVYLSQEKDTFSQYFKKKGLKRPDFLILLEGINTFIVVDVKSKLFYPPDEPTYLCIDEKEVKQYRDVELRFNIPVWFAVTHSENKTFDNWYWIRSTRILLEVGRLEEDRYNIDLDKCIQLNKDSSIISIFSAS